MTELERAPTLPALTGLRAVAALWVVLHHYFDKLVLLFPQTEIIRPFAEAGGIGVELFFVLSGFVITLNYYKKFQHFSISKYVTFLQARIARIYPVVIACLAVLVGIVFLARRMNLDLNTEDLYTGGGFLASLLMVQAWGDSGVATWNFVAWSVSAEWFAYLCFPLVALLFWKIKTPASALAIAVLSILICTVLIDTRGLRLISPFDHVLLLRVLGGFLTGAMMCWLWSRRIGQGYNWNVLTPILALLIGTGASLLTANEIVSYWIVFFIAPFVLGLAYSRAGLSSFLSTPLADFGGRVSYSLYMTHLILKMVLVKLLPVERYVDSGVFVRLGVAGAYILLIALVAIGMYLLIEEPFRARLRPRKPADLQVVKPSHSAQ